VWFLYGVDFRENFAMTQKTTYTILFIAFDLLALAFFASSIYLEYQQLEVERSTHMYIKDTNMYVKDTNMYIEAMWVSVLESNP